MIHTKKAQHSGTSSSHNEYMAAFHAAKEVKWIRDLLMELDLPMHDWSKPVIMLGDNDQVSFMMLIIVTILTLSAFSLVT